MNLSLELQRGFKARAADDPADRARSGHNSTSRPIVSCQACAEHLGGSDDEGRSSEQPATRRPAPFLFEGQMSGEGPDIATTSEHSEAAAMELLQATLFSHFRPDAEAADPPAESTGEAGEGTGGQAAGGNGQQGGGRPDPASAARIFAALRALAEARGEVGACLSRLWET